jgi:hypothetical protein
MLSVALHLGRVTRVIRSLIQSGPSSLLAKSLPPPQPYKLNVASTTIHLQDSLNAQNIIMSYHTESPPCTQEEISCWFSTRLEHILRLRNSQPKSQMMGWAAHRLMSSQGISSQEISSQEISSQGTEYRPGNTPRDCP